MTALSFASGSCETFFPPLAGGVLQLAVHMHKFQKSGVQKPDSFSEKEKGFKEKLQNIRSRRTV